MVHKENFILYLFIPINYIFKYIKLCTYRSIYLGTYISFCWHSFSKISLYSCNYILSLTFFLSLTFIFFFFLSLLVSLCVWTLNFTSIFLHTLVGQDGMELSIPLPQVQLGS